MKLKTLPVNQKQALCRERAYISIRKYSIVIRILATFYQLSRLFGKIKHSINVIALSSQYYVKYPGQQSESCKNI